MENCVRGFKKRRRWQIELHTYGDAEVFESQGKRAAVRFRAKARRVRMRWGQDYPPSERRLLLLLTLHSCSVHDSFLFSSGQKSRAERTWRKRRLQVKHTTDGEVCVCFFSPATWIILLCLWRLLQEKHSVSFCWTRVVSNSFGVSHANGIQCHVSRVNSDLSNVDLLFTLPHCANPFCA